MKKRTIYKTLSMLMVSAMVVAPTVSAADKRQEVGNVSETEITVGVKSSFGTSDPTDLSGIIVSLPSELDLSYDTDKKTYVREDYVSAKGRLASSRVLTVSVSRSLKYTNEEDSSDILKAGVKFKRVTKGIEYWTSGELKANAVTGAAIDKRDLAITLKDEPDSGTYNSNVVFDIEVVKVENEADLGEDITLYNNSDDKTYSLFIEKDDALPETYTVPAYIKADDGTICPVTWFYGSSFTDNNIITTLKISEGITTINNLGNCKNLSSVTLPDSLETIGESAFSKTSSLKKISIPDNVTEIGVSAFAESGLKTIDLSNLDLSDSAYFGKDAKEASDNGAQFSECNLSSVILPDSAYTIPTHCFYADGGLTNITLGAKVIQDDAFTGCINLQFVKYLGTEEEFKAIDGVNNILPSTTGVTTLTVRCTDGDLTFKQSDTI